MHYWDLGRGGFGGLALQVVLRSAYLALSMPFWFETGARVGSRVTEMRSLDSSRTAPKTTLPPGRLKLQKFELAPLPYYKTAIKKFCLGIQKPTGVFSIVC